VAPYAEVYGGDVLNATMDRYADERALINPLRIKEWVRWPIG
jgi:galactokinase/mevalonate kinase-like predicted kinase